MGKDLLKVSYSLALLPFLIISLILLYLVASLLLIKESILVIIVLLYFLQLMLWSVLVLMFFLKVEVGIQFIGVTGVQTCAFFFSSRRRHTRYWRDWSSDVCSSDLSRIITTLRSLTRTPTTLTTCTDVSSTVTESG